MHELDVYDNSYILRSKKISKTYGLYLFLIILFLIFSLIFVLNYKIKNNLWIKAIAKDKLVEFNISDSYLNYLLDSKEIFINGNNYVVDQINVSNPLIESKSIYYDVSITIIGDCEYLINNKILDLKILGQDEVLYKKIIKIIKGV